jgi:hypothetical protein
MLRIFLLFTFFTFSTLAYSSSGAVLAVVDSWFDKSQPLFSGRIFVNTKEKFNGRDDDGNGYIDDVSGWNFYHKNNHLFEYEDDKQFSTDLYRFYALRAKRKSVGLTKEEDAWVKKIYADEKFKQEYSIFRRYSHGTHVGSIALLGDVINPLFSQIPANFKLLPIKLFGSRLDWDNVDGTTQDRRHPVPGDYSGISETKKKMLIKKDLLQEAQELGSRSKSAFKYLGRYAQVANCSYGNSHSSLYSTVKKYFGYYYTRKPNKAELNELLDFYVQQIETELRQAVALAPNTLFIFSAGNRGKDNDKFYHYPSNLKARNTIAVASTYKDIRLGVKSNFGKRSVDLAAPGIAVTGVIPNGKKVKMSGTSQAAPYVAHLAIRIVESYKRRGKYISVSQLKKKLLTLIDKKTFLQEKVVTNGMVSVRKIAEIID